MRETKRLFCLLLALALVLSVLGMSALAVEPVTDAAVIVQRMQAGTQITSDTFTVPEGARYGAVLGDAAIIPYSGSGAVLRWLESGETLESGHIYVFYMMLLPATGYTLPEDLSITVQNADKSYTPVRNKVHHTNPDGVGYFTFTLEYTVGSVPAATVVTDMAFTTDAELLPVVGRPLAQKLTVSTTPAGGTASQTPLSWRTAAPGGSLLSVTGTVKAGQLYYQPIFSCQPAEAHRFASGMKFTLNGAPMPDSMLLVLTRTADTVACERYRYYGITVRSAAHGRASAPAYAAGGEFVKLTATPDKGYQLAGWSVTDQRGSQIEVTADNTFLMPDPLLYTESPTGLQCVSVTPLFSAESAHTHTWDAGTVTRAPTTTAEGVRTYTCTGCGLTRTEPIPKLPRACDGGALCPSISLTDVDRSPDSWYHLPVDWAFETGVTEGKTDTLFAPTDPCTRAQAVTFLWRAMGSHEPKTTVNPFRDVRPDAYYYKAVLWAVENEITDGIGPGVFAPDGTCTRGHIVTFLWRAMGRQTAAAASAFRDVAPGAWYYDAVSWAVEKKITDGVSETLFAPGNDCTRAHIVTFLYRAQ